MNLTVAVLWTLSLRCIHSALMNYKNSTLEDGLKSNHLDTDEHVFSIILKNNEKLLKDAGNRIIQFGDILVDESRNAIICDRNAPRSCRWPPSNDGNIYVPYILSDQFRHEHNFNRFLTNNVNTEYDYNSVMHYGSHAFAKPGTVTIAAKPDPTGEIGQERGITTKDVYKIKTLYNCEMCSNMFVDKSGNFTTPNFPLNYPNNADCRWIIRSPHHNKILLEFSEFAVQEFSACLGDHLTVYDGPDLLSKLLVRPACGAENPAAMSTRNELLVTFTSTWRLPVRGFSAKYKFVECGYMVTNRNGDIARKAGHSKYTHCYWVLLSKMKHKYMLKIEELHVQETPNCTENYLAIHDHARGPPHIAGKYCGKVSLPINISPYGRTAVLEFRQNKTQDDYGFKLTYRNVAKHYSNSKILIQGRCTNNGEIIEDGFYLWSSINLNPDEHIMEESSNGNSQKGKQESSDVNIFTRISKINEDLGSHRADIGYGDIATGSSKNAQKCLFGPTYCLWPRDRDGTVYIPYTLDSAFSKSQQTVIHNALELFAVLTCIKFVYRQQEKNYVQIISKKGCWSNVGYIRQKQIVSLDKSGCVSHGVIQHELLHTIGFNHEQSRSDRDNYVTILYENIKKDVEDNFEILDTNNLGTIYDYNSVMHYDRYAFSKNGNVTILPKPDPNVPIGQDYGMTTLDVYKVNKLYNCKICGGLLMKDHGLLNSPGFPDLYPNNLHCLWLIRTPNYKNKIFLKFTKFQVEQFINCYSDRVIIYDGESLVSPVLEGPTCGSENPAVVSSGGSLLVEFFSSRTWRAYGFSAQFQFVKCGYTLKDKKGTIDFRAWKKDNSRQRCWWALLIPRAFKIVFTLITLHISSDGNCTEDYLVIHDVASNPSTILGKYCGKRLDPIVFTSSGRTLVLELSHLMADLGWGFTAEYKSIANKRPPKVTAYSSKGSLKYLSPNILVLVLTSTALHFCVFHYYPFVLYND